MLVMVAGAPQWLPRHIEMCIRDRSKITTRLSAVGIHGSIYGRIKHVYSIYRKMKAQGKGINELYDMYAFRCV